MSVPGMKAASDSWTRGLLPRRSNFIVFLPRFDLAIYPTSETGRFRKLQRAITPLPWAQTGATTVQCRTVLEFGLVQSKSLNVTVAVERQDFRIIMRFVPRECGAQFGVTAIGSRVAKLGIRTLTPYNYRFVTKATI